MLVYRPWLSKFFDTELPKAEELADALTFHAFEIEKIEGEVLEVNVTPNRGHDCLSHRGIAKEISAILNIPLTHDPFLDIGDTAHATNEVKVTIENPEFCRRYIAGYIKGVKVGPSPLWLKKNLEAIGQRSINNIVDATNFVMFNTGQPLHAFDAGKLKNFELGVRAAREGEVIEALDHKKYTLSERMSVITAGDEPVAIAGVKGGLPCGVEEETTDIIIESANFAGPPVRKTAQALKLRTDASSRFEQEISPELARIGVQSVVELIQKIAGGELVGFVDAYPKPQASKSVSVTLEKIQNILGVTLTSSEVADVFTRLGFEFKEKNGEFSVEVPFERLDLTIPEDLVEEVARIVGYERIEGKALRAPSRSIEINAQFFAAEKAREELVSLGYSEVYTSVFADKGERAVLNKADGARPFMRTTLTHGLNQVLKKNIPNKDLLGLKEIKLFEIGAVWKDGKEVVMLGRVGEKEPAHEEELQDIEAEVYEALPLSEATQFEAFSKFPYIVRDIAMWVPAGTDLEEVRKILYEVGGELVQKVSLFDEFKKGEKTSLAFRLIFQSFDRTLTEEEANTAMQKVSETLKKKGFEIR